ncbi:exported protein of unknown function [Nitrospira japonica]|uniref:DUF4398 domain-containing protein n=1 Tax=Nitrospira japonica TaxID=1325564 RepID=A0A1W1I0I6_9BACT|nr:hypothetical protein [Nitrospira japonica]SLM46520.1 exported protein of unknown function [Nitrospira japonica]
MKTQATHTAQAGLLAAVMLLSGCAAEMTDTSAASGQPAGPRFVSQDQARELTAQYQRQASDLRALAARAEWEARWYESQLGVGDQEASRRRTQARQLWAAAEQADQLAIDYRRQVPHGQMQ